MKVMLHTFCGYTRELEVPYPSRILEMPMERPFSVWQHAEWLRFTRRRFEWRRTCKSGTEHFYELAE